MLLIRAWFLFPVFDLALGLLPFPLLYRYARQGALPASPSAPDPAKDNPAPSRMAWLVERVGRYSLTRPTCLTQALVLTRLLARNGMGSTLRIGVARATSPLSAHAWLECQGQALIGEVEAQGYTPLSPADTHATSRP